MKRSSRRSCIAPEVAPAFDLSSLIDVSFLLLIYFLATSTLQPKEVDESHLGKPLGRNPIFWRYKIKKLHPVPIDSYWVSILFDGENASEVALQAD